jgi:hypothetical protein
VSSSLELGWAPFQAQRPRTGVGTLPACYGQRAGNDDRALGYPSAKDGGFTFIKASGKANDMFRTEFRLSKMLESEVTPSVVCYTTVLLTHAREGNFQAAEKGLERMGEKGMLRTGAHLFNKGGGL